MERKSRNTKQKEILKETVLDFKSFFTAEEILDNAKEKDSKLGIATVYRFLKESQKKGLVHSYTCNRRTIYSVEKNSHCHFICDKCGVVSHINVKSIDFIKEKIKGSIRNFQVDVNGICEKCLK